MSLQTREAGWWRSVLTLLAGSAAAQALPLLLGPLLTRLFSPEEFGQYHLFAAVAANLGVVGCARFEFALPLARDDAQADALRRLCLRVLVGVCLLSAVGAAAWWLWGRGGAWVGCLPLAVAGSGAVSLATLWATRAQRFQALAGARVLQYGGAALAQVAAGWAGAGLWGLILAPIVACGLATWWLRLPLGGRDGDPGSHAHRPGPLDWQALVREFREFPLLNTPHAFAGALQDTVSLALIAAWLGPPAAGFWGLSLRYLKAPASLVGGAVSQVLYPRLAEAAGEPTLQARQAVRRVMAGLALLAVPLVLGLWWLAPWIFVGLFGAPWRGAGELAQALSLYIGLHFVAAPLAVVTMAWRAQGWALRLALVGQLLFVLALLIGLWLGDLQAAGWAVSVAMLGYFGFYFWRLATWPVVAARPVSARK